MSERIELTDEMTNQIVGGNIQAVIANGQIYLYGTHNPDVHFGFSNYQDVQKFVADNYDLYGEMGTLMAMVNAGICWQL